jgi:uncharacterized membrane protein YhaH (DUF805 family)
MWYRYGRINRPTYFLGLALLVAVYAAVNAVMTRPTGMSEVLIILLMVPRLHDIGKSGWWAGALILGEIVVVGLAVWAATAMKNDEIILIASGLFVLVALGLLVLLGCIRGQPGSNKWGAPPPPGLSLKTYKAGKDTEEADAFS